MLFSGSPERAPRVFGHRTQLSLALRAQLRIASQFYPVRGKAAQGGADVRVRQEKGANEKTTPFGVVFRCSRSIKMQLLNLVKYSALPNVK